MTALLDYHNRVRSQVFPPAANMEYMVWDERLAKSAESWASQCIWDHGPPHVLRSTGQNLSIISGRYRSIVDLVRSWYGCSGSVCTHYTQMVWANSNKIGCAVRRCSNINVFGSMWKQATLLVCNYSIKGNWVGELHIRLENHALRVPQAMEDHAIKTSVTLDQNPEEVRVVSEAKRGEKMILFYLKCNH
ncbi:hypothetical protein PO909_014013 [Leuciscus waleckii]